MNTRPASKRSPKQSHRNQAGAKQTQASPAAASATLEDGTTDNGQAIANNIARAGELWQRIAQALAAHSLNRPEAFASTDSLTFAQSLMEASKQMTIDPQTVMQSQIGLLHDHMKLWENMTNKLLGKVTTPYVEAPSKDRRFRDEAWNSSAMYDYIKQGYLINARWLQDGVNNIQGVDPHTAKKLTFFTRQFVDAMAPSNFLLTNPEVMRATLESNGENIVSGMEQLLGDIEKSQGRLRISMTPDDAFTLGKDIATAKGSVVYQNDLMQLIQYEATTKQVHKTPLLLIPAWINKYYIFDLKPESSFIGWLTAQGYTVFVISWVNPDEKLGRKSFDDYLLQGPLAALDVIEQITKSSQTSIVGYCLGGTLSAITLSYLKSIGEDNRVASVTYLTTLIDFTEAGEISVFIDDAQLGALEERMSERGYLDGADMAATFNMLRANDLIWSFVINNYMLGKQPFPFDLLYWNADSTRMPATMHAFYLRHMYQRNDLVKPGGIEVCNTPIHVAKIKTPSYILATREDHIAPWTSAYLASQIYDGDVTFTLADSGHVAGVINPPTKNKYCYWTSKKLPLKAEQWFDSATQYAGSWWPNWSAWQQQFAAGKITARAVGSAKYKPIEAAPGAYAKVRA
jgi:polyhydroxyalkanoate synthase